MLLQIRPKENHGNASPRLQPIFDLDGDVRLGARSIQGKIDNRSAREARNEIRPSKLTSPAEPERCAVAFEEHPRRR